MGNQIARHEEIEVGGRLDEARLRAIAVRALYLRNYLARAEDPEVTRLLTAQQHDPVGETPVLVECRRGDESDDPSSIELHVGCGEVCPVLAEIPYDGDSGGPSREAAEAIVHAGQDMIDLAREVVALRAQIAAARARLDGVDVLGAIERRSDLIEAQRRLINELTDRRVLAEVVRPMREAVLVAEAALEHGALETIEHSQDGALRETTP